MELKNYIKIIFVLGVCCNLLSSCATGTPELAGLSPQAQAEVIKNYGGIYKIGKPYQIAGRWYYPKEDYNYSETGMASWYGEDFNGKRTANGERYNMNTLTAAHRTLPLPCIVKVTNLQNGRSVVVRVNDRGPYVKDRIIDLSKHGAQLLGYMGQGTTKVKVEIMEKESKALKAAMLNEPQEQQAEALAAAESATPAPSLMESSAERVEISKEESKKMAEVYASAGNNKIATGSYEPQGKTAEPAVYGSAAAADGSTKTGALGQVSTTEHVSDSKGVYGKAANNPAAVGAKATNSRGYQYQSGYYYIQAGAFSRYDLAHKQMVRLKEYGSSHIMNVESNGKKVYRVVVGPFSQQQEAVVAQAKLKYYGVTDTRIEKK
ncbi:MAG: septal ring lytic transglycosylase RlpA family protein [Alphaproteobacteria bacterium]|nr:septal ring lytic transglycosylase RlpA family protein [Alphaproteobacteria bacterium]